MLKLDGKDKETAEIGIFGGTGIYDSGLLKEPKEIEIDTPVSYTHLTLPTKRIV